MGARIAILEISLNPHRGIFFRQVAYSKRDVRPKGFQTENSFFTHVSRCLFQDKGANREGKEVSNTREEKASPKSKTKREAYRWRQLILQNGSKYLPSYTSRHPTRR
jgi:hypothetical protein